MRGSTLLGLGWLAAVVVALEVGADPIFVAGVTPQGPRQAVDAQVVPVSGQADGAPINRTDMFIQRFIKRRQELVDPGDREIDGWGGIYESATRRSRNQPQADPEPQPEPEADDEPARPRRPAAASSAEPAPIDWVPQTAQRPTPSQPQPVAPAESAEPPVMEHPVPEAATPRPDAPPASPKPVAVPAAEALQPVQEMEIGSDGAAPAAPRSPAPPSRPSTVEAPTTGLEVEISGPDSVALGDRASYTIVVRNPRNVRSAPALLAVTLPEGSRGVRATPAFGEEGPFWSLEGIAPGDQRRLTVEFQAGSVGATEVVAELAIPQRAVQSLEILAPRLEFATADNQVLPLNKSLPVTVTVTNRGPVAAKGVELTLELPAHIKSPSGKSPTIKLGEIAPGGQQTARVSLEGSRTGSTQMAMTVRAAGGIEARHTLATQVVSPDVTVRTQGPETLAIGRIQEFAVEVTNTSPLVLPEVTVIVAVSEGLKLVDAETGAHLDQSKRLVGWEIAQLEANETKTLRWWIVGHREGLGDQRVFVEAEGGIRKNQRVTHKLTAAPDVQLQMISESSPVAVGDETIYRFRLVNHGRSSVMRLVVSGTLGEGLEPIQLRGSTEQSWKDNNVTFAPIERLSPGESRLFQIRARAVAPGATEFRLQVESKNTGETLDKIEDRRVVE